MPPIPLRPQQQPPPAGSRFSHVTAGLAGGLITLAATVALALTGAFRGPAPEDPESERGGNGALSVARIHERTGRSVAFVRAAGDGGVATGSGVVVDRRGRLVTNARVVAGARSVTVQLGPGQPLRARVVGADASTDLALLRVDPGAVRLRAVRLDDAERVHVGQPVVVIGNPFGLDRAVSTGIVSALQRRIPGPRGSAVDNVIQTDAAIVGASAGGPMLDRRGRVVGVTSRLGGVGFAIPSETVKRVVARLARAGR